jgi:gliding motility-associated-like protein
VTQSGTYGVSIVKNGSSCTLEDEVVFTDLQVQSPVDLTLCHDDSGNYTYDLTLNDEAALGINNNKYDLEYYASLSDLNSGNPISSSLNAYQSSGNQTIYIKIVNNNTGQSCDAAYPFDLLINPEISLQTPDPIEICANSGSNVDLTQNNSQIITGNYDFSFFITEADAQNNANPIADPTSYPIPNAIVSNGNMFTVWVRVEDAAKPECFEVISLDVVVNPPPPVDSLPDVTECSTYVLPPLQNGNYYSGSNGSGTPYFAGDSIDKTGTYYIFNGPDINGCTNQTSFKVTLVDEYSVKEEHCGDFTIPSPPAGAFYTAPGGPAGTGTQIPTGTVLTTSQTIYHYAEINGIFCRDKAFPITIFPLPPVDSLPDVVTCNQFVLPVLTDGNYFTKPKGKGAQLNAGDAITSTQTIYIFSDDGRCTDQTKFKVTILPDFQDVTACGSYTLPQLDVGGFFTQPGGQGQQIPDGTSFTTTPPNILVETIYYYAQTTTSPNCTDNLSFTLTVFPIPEVDELDDFLLCEGEAFILPNLVDGEYFTKPNRKGTPLFPGDSISVTTTVYINNTENGCSSETDFIVEIRPLPEVEDFTDIYSCEPFELPPLEHGNFYTQPGGNGQMLNAGDLIYTTQKLYIFNAYDDLATCYSENAFTVYVQGIEVGTFEDVSACDLYVLPNLQIGDYFTKSGGKGTPLFPGDTIQTDREIFVFGINGDRFPCTDEDNFLVNISETPILPDFEDVEACGSYTLPDLSQEDYNVGYYYGPNGENPIPPSEFLFSGAGNYTIYVYATAKDNPECFDEAVFKLSVFPRPDLEIEGGTICLDAKTGEVVSSPVLNSGLDPKEFTVNWYLDGELMHSGPDFSPTEAGNYTVETLKLTPEIGADCNYDPTTVRVYESAQPIIRAQVTEPFSDMAVITVEVVDGVGEYEFRLDEHAFGPENVFENVESGTHVIRVRGINGACGEAVMEVEVLHFPKFFTPNNDGHNDRWNIPDLKNHPEAKILIFDRYGKLLAKIKPNRSGWDGNYNGNPMPSDDYWFVVNFEQDGKAKVFKSHFSLIR